MTRVVFRLPWGRHRALTMAEVAAYGLIGLWVAFVLWAAWNTQRQESDNALYVGARIVGGTASTFVAVAAAWVLFFYQRRMVTRRRLLTDVTRRNRDALPSSVNVDVIDQLVTLLTSPRSTAHLVVVADDPTLRHSVIEGLSRRLAEAQVLPTWVASAESSASFEEAAKQSYLALADHAGERGDDLGRLWNHLWDQRALVVIAGSIDAGEAPGEPSSIQRVDERLSDLARLDAPTIALVSAGTTDPSVEVCAIFDSFDTSPVGPGAVEGVLEPVALAALRHIGRILHLRNEVTWTWADVPADLHDGELTVGTAWLVAHGHVTTHANGTLQFTNRHELARARGLGAGADTHSQWATVLDLPVTAVTLESLEIAARDDGDFSTEGEANETLLDSVSERMGIGRFVTVDLSIFTAVYAGIASRLGFDRVSPAVTNGTFTAWRPDPPATPTDHARLVALSRLGIAESNALRTWAWEELRDAALPATTLTYPVRRALITELVKNCDGSIESLADRWDGDARLLSGGRAGTVEPLLAPPVLAGMAAQEEWAETVGAACHLAWLLPLAYAGASADLRARIAPTMDCLQQTATATARHITTDQRASIDYLQGWAEGLYYGAVAVGDAGQGTRISDCVTAGLAEPHTWPGHLALIMAEVAMGRPCPSASSAEHPIVIAMAGELRKVDSLSGSDRDQALSRVMWREEFAELRAAAPGLQPQVRWILAAKAILFSGAEVRRGPKGAQLASGVEDRRRLLLGTDVLPEWLSRGWDSGAPSAEQPGQCTVTLEGIRGRPDRRVTQTFAGLVLAGPKPESAKQDHVQRQFWTGIDDALQRLAG